MDDKIIKKLKLDSFENKDIVKKAKENITTIKYKNIDNIENIIINLQVKLRNYEY